MPYDKFVNAEPRYTLLVLRVFDNICAVSAFILAASLIVLKAPIELDLPTGDESPR